MEQIPLEVLGLDPDTGLGPAAQRWHEERQGADPGHDRSSCWCCCPDCWPD